MSKNPVKLKIARLYPDNLQGLCDEANINVFLKRANWRDIEVEVCEIKANEKIPASKFDFYYLGGSNFGVLEKCSQYLFQNQSELKNAQSARIPILAVNCGYVLIGKTYKFENGIENEGIGLLDIASHENKVQFYQNIVGECEFLKNKTIAGFKNQIMVSYLNNSTRPFIKIKKGVGNNQKDKFEGAFLNNTIGTYITSPLLAQNPHLCDFLISKALEIKYGYTIPLSPLCDDIEWYSHNYIVESK